MLQAGVASHATGAPPVRRCDVAMGGIMLRGSVVVLRGVLQASVASHAIGALSVLRADTTGESLVLQVML